MKFRPILCKAGKFLPAVGLFFIIQNAFGQERIESAFLKESEISSAIHAKLGGTMDKKNYALQVDVQTKRISESPDEAPASGLKSFNTDSDLPGFEMSKEVIRPDIDELLGETYLAIEKIKIALILHKKITPSETDYIRQMVPIVANFDFSRGDEFNFIPITPDKIAEEKSETPNTEDFIPLDPIGEEVPPIALEELAQETGWLQTLKENWLPILLGALVLVLILILALVLIFGNRKKEDENRPSALDELKALKEQQLKEANQAMESAMLKEKNTKMNKEIIADLLGDEKLVEGLMEDLFKDKKGKNKLAAIISIFGESVSRKLFSHYLPKESFLELLQQAAKSNPSPEEESKVLEELQTVLYAKKFSGKGKSEEKPFKFLDNLTSNQIAFLIKNEQPNIQAIVISRMESSEAAGIIKKFDPARRAKIIESFGKMEKIPLELVKNVAYTLANKARDLPDDKTVSIDGVKVLADMIGFSDPETRTSIINDLRTGNQKLSLDVESRLFVFESVPAVPGEIISRVFRKMPMDDVITAIANSEKELKEAVIMAFPENVRAVMVSKLKSLSPWPTEKEILEKQKSVVAEMQALADSGKIDLRAIQSAWEKFNTNKKRAAS